MGSYLSTFEHELTHALFAWLTLHEVTGLSVTWRSGGQCTFRGSGGGNWLIAIAPYWVPTLTIPLMIYQYVTGQQSHVTQCLIGITSAYHLTSTWRETHLKQPDLQQTGFVFALLFLPTANVLVYGFVTISSICGIEAGAQFVHQVVNDTLGWATECLSRLS
ncbi:MAG: M50 family metallopeptidase [Bradymonadia bacterium]